MKRLTAMLLALVMVFSLSVTAFADEAGTETTANKATADKDSEYKASIDVNAKYISRLDSEKIISVDVAWQDMNFIYYASQQGTWDPSEHKYTGETSAKWNKTTSDITVTNHSNAEVTATLSYTQSVTTVTGSLSASELTLESAAQEKYMGENDDKAPSATSTFTIGGYMESSSSTDLGTITVALKEGSGSGDTEDKGDTDNGIEWTEVSDFDTLKTALETGGNVKLTEDIEGPSTFPEGRILPKISFSLDLNGHQLTLNKIDIWDESVIASISNGTIISTDSSSAAVNVSRGSYLEINNCTLTGSNYWALYIYQGAVTVKNTTLNGGVCVQNSATLTATDNVTVNKNGYGITVSDGGSATFSYDPTDLLSTYYNTGTVTNNGNGTWTVTAP